MHQADIECIACGCEIRQNQLYGESECRHGYMHYNCSYLGVICAICSKQLIISVDHQTQADMHIATHPPMAPISNSHPSYQDRSSMTVELELAEIKRIMLLMKSQVMTKLTEMSTEIEGLKTKILEQQAEIFKIKIEALQKEMMAGFKITQNGTSTQDNNKE